MPVLTSVLHEFLGKAEVTASVHHIEKYKKSGIPIYNFKALDTAGKKKKKTRSRKKRRSPANTVRYVFRTNAKILQYPPCTLQIIVPGKTKN